MRKVTAQRLAEFTERDYVLTFGVGKREFDRMLAALEDAYRREPVSYTHLDVYKRQGWKRCFRPRPPTRYRATDHRTAAGNHTPDIPLHSPEQSRHQSRYSPDIHW